MTQETTDLAGALSRGLSGEETPGRMKIRAPSRAATLCQAGALAAACVFAATAFILIARLIDHPKADIELLKVLAHGVIWMGLSCIACIGLSALSQFFSHLVGEAGPAKIDVSGEGR